MLFRRGRRTNVAALGRVLPPPGTPNRLCISSSTASGAHVTTIADAPVGSLIVVAVSTWAGLNGTATGVTDSAGNTYSLAIQGAAIAAVPYPAAIYYCINSAFDLPNGGWIAVTNSGAIVDNVYACSVSGANGGLDATNSGHVAASSSTISLATGALASANEIVFGLTATSDSLTGFANSAGFTELAFGVSGGSNASGFGYDIVSSNASVTYAPTWTSARAAGVMASFKAG